jgi:hypothetical protein
MPQVGFESTIPVFGRAKTIHALDRAATVIGYSFIHENNITITQVKIQVGLEETVQTRIREVLNSSLGQVTCYPAPVFRCFAQRFLAYVGTILGLSHGRFFPIHLSSIILLSEDIWSKT